MGGMGGEVVTPRAQPKAPQANGVATSAEASTQTRTQATSGRWGQAQLAVPLSRKKCLGLKWNPGFFEC